MEIIDYSDQIDAIPAHRDAANLAEREQENWITFHFSAVVHKPANRNTELKRMLGEAKYHKDKNWGTAQRPAYANNYMYDYVVLSDGLVVKTYKKRRRLWHCGNTTGNNESWSVHVMLGENQHMTDAQKTSLFELFDKLREESGIPKERVVGHCEWPQNSGDAVVSNTFRVQPGQSSCPGNILFNNILEYRTESINKPWNMRIKNNIDFAAVRTGRGIKYPMAQIDGEDVKLDPGSIVTIRDIIDGWAHLDSEIGFVSEVLLEQDKSINNNTSDDISILEKPEHDTNRIIDKIASLSKQKYTKKEVATIVHLYQRYADEADINWIVALAQNLHETNWLRSWWAQPPRRNPAGLGVNGESMAEEPEDITSWAEQDGTWYHGYSFDSWEDAVQAHIGHLLLYTLKDSEMNNTQKELGNKSPRKKAVEDAGYRGTAKTLKGLTGKWATDPEYDKKIVKTINKVIQ